MRYVYWIFWILLFALMVLFAVYNLDQTQVHLFSKTASFQLPLFILLASSFLAGIIVSLLMNMMGSLKRRRLYAQLKSDYKKLEKEVERLRQADVAHRMAQTQQPAASAALPASSTASTPSPTSTQS